MRMDLYECDNCPDLFAVSLGSVKICCPYCSENTTEYKETIEVEMNKPVSQGSK